jgi:serine/threonine-protein kinase
VIGVGTRIREYEIVAHLRAGGMATLFLGRRLGAAGFHKLVAVKIVHPHLAKDPSFVQMFVDEALLSARIQHPNVVHVEELGQAEDTYFLVMEYVHGVSLSQLLTALAKMGRRLTPELAVHIAIKVAEGLHAAHETTGDDGQLLGVVHRDISPQNVLVSSRGHVKLIDFGIAKAAGRIQQTTSASLKGKIRYMAPEQAFGRAVDRRTDVYALAIVLWEMLTMRRMFTADNDFALLDRVRNPEHRPPSDHAPGLPPALDAAILRALSVDALHRTPTALEFRRDLAAAMPSALVLDEQRLAELVIAACATDLEAERKILSSLSKSATLMEIAGATPPPAPLAIENLTVSASHLQLLPPEQALVSEASPPAVSVAVPFAAPPAPVAPPEGGGAERSPLLLAAGAVALLLAGGGAGLAVVSMRGGAEEVRATPTAPVPAPAGVGAPAPAPATAVPNPAVPLPEVPAPAVAAPAVPAPAVAAPAVPAPVVAAPGMGVAGEASALAAATAPEPVAVPAQDAGVLSAAVGATGPRGGGATKRRGGGSRAGGGASGPGGGAGGNGAGGTGARGGGDIPLAGSFD